MWMVVGAGCHPFLSNKTASGVFHNEKLTGSNAVLTTNNTTTSPCLIPERKCSYDNWDILPLWLMFDLRYLNNEDLLDLQTLALDSAKWDISSGRKWLYVHVSLLTLYRGELVVLKWVGRSSRLSALFINKTTSGTFPNGGVYKWPLRGGGIDWYCNLVAWLSIYTHQMEHWRETMLT